ncbi:hypothetical protein B0A48_10262 [Cryoendolithus antarcticus]|uniref:Inositol polyphosphate-related phosphatase domain-containing protein n=1 Tax=Cryoendolithus antarcticus TaxID=1507870 RepID=A0A1V8SWR3_9PEZI|nr:hypothetical protein B0A48_10262 [Cryoendolithus antarcticus]
MALSTATSSRPASTISTISASSLMQNVPGHFPAPTPSEEDLEVPLQSLSQAVHARRAEYVRPKHVRIKLGTWNTAAFKGTEKDVAGWFVEGKGVTSEFAGLNLGDAAKERLEDREGPAEQEARYEKKAGTLPQGDVGVLPGRGDVGLYVLGLQEVVDITSFTEALRPYTDPSVAIRWKEAVKEGLPEDYVLVAEQQLLGLLLLIYAAPEVASEVRSVSTTSVGTGIGGYMGNKGAVTARIVLGETTRLVFVNCHMAAGADKPSLERRNWDASQILSRTRFEPIKDSMDLAQTTGEQIGDEDFAFWMGDLNYRLQDIPGDDVRRLLMLHTRNEYDLSQRSARKIDGEIENAKESVKRRVEGRLSDESNDTASTSAASGRTSQDTTSTAPTLMDEVSASEDPTSLQTTLACLLPHDELHAQMKTRKAFHDGWREGPIRFLPTYKYDVGSVGVFDSSDKKRSPSWCDRILYRSRRDRLAYEARIKEEETARRKDEEMKANGTDLAASDDEILFDYDPETDGGERDYDEYDDNADGVVITREGFEDELTQEYYTAHQRVLSSDHKPLDAVFMLKYDAVVSELKAKVHTEVAKELDKVENDSRPDVTVVVDKHRAEDTESDDTDPANFEGVWFGEVRWGQAKHRTLTIANTGRVAASFTLIERPVGAGQSSGVAPKWLNLKVNNEHVRSSSTGSQAVRLEPGETTIIELELRIFDVSVATSLNEGSETLDDILVLRVAEGRDHFVPVRGTWLETSLGRSISKLVRIPEGGIRRLQRQTPEGKNRSRGTSAASGTKSSMDSPRISLQDAPVRFSAPRELFRLTEVVEELSGRVVAEWEMTSNEDSGKPPWVGHPSWPFEEACWTEKGTEQWNEALSDACDALDSDKPLEASMPGGLPKMQRLYVLAQLLLLFLEGIPEGVIPDEIWLEIEACLASTGRAKPEPNAEEQRMAISELLSQSPSHSISFVLITSMLDRLVQEITKSDTKEPEAEPAATSPRRLAGPFRRMTGTGKLPTLAPREQSAHALAKIFAPLVAPVPTSGGDKARSTHERRRVELMELFLLKRGNG